MRSPQPDEPAVADTTPPVELSPGLDKAAIRSVFARAGRVHISGILAPECAARIHECLVRETPWQLHMNDGRSHFDVADQQMQLMPEASRVLLLDTVHDNARSRFQCIYNSWPIYDAYAAGRSLDLYLMRVFEFLNSPSFLNFARAVTGLEAIGMTDAQATLYRPGHFLTVHEDLDEGKGRLAAYVLNFKPGWRADWGGILQFIDKDGHVAEGYTPAFNAMNLFRVPQAHAVSYIAPYATGGRYSITGWLREIVPRR